MKLKARYEMDKAAEIDGRWVAWGDGAELKVARANNQNAQKLRERLMAPFERPGFRTRKASEEEQAAILRQVLAHACLKDWRGVELTPEEVDHLAAEYGVQVADPKRPAYTPELGVALMTLYEDFLRDVLTVATNEDLFRAEQVEEDRGN
ncbi:MAG TPA: hypothetical protein P5144_15895 [Thermoanaerobaculia bacterium]|nr:hypothetical protein [Thermoanaerobaculaceae bacterium]HRS37437.1 hypothetical protein [Thermoanaerobaculia bacterium]HRU10859.1 hypothetical protein [Thermoanaerobaculia bacterium]